ncbi:MAG: VOC family protein [Rhodospirillaceae bacterium]|nr:VOC family protein [Rhodospirillaceae bacterium]
MRDGIQGLGWFVRRTPNAEALARFYRDALQLPVLRSWDRFEGAGTMFYAGDVGTFEINAGGKSAIADPNFAECTPIFRARDVATTEHDILNAGGHAVGAEKTERHVTHFYTDPQGHVFGLRTADDASDFAPDVEAAKRWAAGERGTPILQSLPETLQDLGTIRLRVEDPVAMAAFYAGMLGLDVLGTPAPDVAHLHLGGTGLLELKSGGARRNPPQDRIDVTDVWILRVYDLISLKAHLAVNNVHEVNAIELPGGWICYYADPEGHVFGFQQRKLPDPNVPTTNLREDLAARKKWEGK